MYIDADTLVLDDVSLLYRQSLENKIIGAVIDPGQAKKLHRLGVQSADYYFNAGVLLIDTKKWNQENITERTIEFLQKNPEKIIYHDQDALNAVLYEKWHHLPPRWNMQTSLIFNRYEAPDPNYKKWYKESHFYPAIVHFTGKDKPWNTLEGHPYQNLYMKKYDVIAERKERTSL